MNNVYVRGKVNLLYPLLKTNLSNNERAKCRVHLSDLCRHFGFMLQTHSDLSKICEILQDGDYIDDSFTYYIKCSMNKQTNRLDYVSHRTGRRI